MSESGKEKLKEGAGNTTKKLEETGPTPKESKEERVFSKEEEEKIKTRLKDLGYID